MTKSNLLVTEIIDTLVGESSWAGLPCTIVRLSGCPLRCRFCDTTYAYEPGQPWEVVALVDEVCRRGYGRILLTGGEPLAQDGCIRLLQLLVEREHQVLLETSGALDISAVPPPVHRIVDVKTPGSGQSERMLLGNLSQLTKRDEVKFVISDRRDFEFAQDIVRRHVAPGIGLLMSPVYGELEAAQLGRWILESGLDARLSVQLHKWFFAALEPRPG